MSPFSRRTAFATYMYVERLVHGILELLPPPIRLLFHRLTLAHLGRRVAIDQGVYIRYPSRVRIGDDVEINRGVQIIPSRLISDAGILIEDRVIIAPDVTLFGAGQSPDPDRHDVAGPIRVCSDAYIGGGSLIRYGVTIGVGSVVAAGSVLTRDVPDHSLVAGVPARIIRSLRGHDDA